MKNFFPFTYIPAQELATIPFPKEAYDLNSLVFVKITSVKQRNPIASHGEKLNIICINNSLFLPPDTGAEKENC